MTLPLSVPLRLCCSALVVWCNRCSHNEPYSLLSWHKSPNNRKCKGIMCLSWKTSVSAEALLFREEKYACPKSCFYAPFPLPFPRKRLPSLSRPWFRRNACQMICIPLMCFDQMRDAKSSGQNRGMQSVSWNKNNIYQLTMDESPPQGPAILWSGSGWLGFRAIIIKL